MHEQCLETTLGRSLYNTSLVGSCGRGCSFPSKGTGQPCAGPRAATKSSPFSKPARCAGFKKQQEEKSVMFRVYAGLTSLLLAASWLVGADDAFEKAERAISAKDYATAITSLEEALTADPDSLRDASEYRQATIRRAFAAHANDPHIKEGVPADYDREIAFFEKLTAANPKSANAFLNY